MHGIDTVISACLLGIPCRYNKQGKFNEEAFNIFLDGRAIIVCPEVFAGLKTPRPACEIIGGDGLDVLAGKAKVLDEEGNEYTNEFMKGAEIVLEIVKKHNIQKAILKSNSPSCGVSSIYSGEFTGKKIKGCGILTAMLKKHGNIKEIDELD